MNIDVEKAARELLKFQIGPRHWFDEAKVREAIDALRSALSRSSRPAESGEGLPDLGKAAHDVWKHAEYDVDRGEFCVPVGEMNALGEALGHDESPPPAPATEAKCLRCGRCDDPIGAPGHGERCPDGEEHRPDCANAICPKCLCVHSTRLACPMQPAPVEAVRDSWWLVETLFWPPKYVAHGYATPSERVFTEDALLAARFDTMEEAEAIADAQSRAMGIDLRAVSHGFEQPPTPRTGASEGEERVYPCAKCGTLRTKAEGGTTFTVCDSCWDALHPLRPTPSPAEVEAKRREFYEAARAEWEARRDDKSQLHRWEAATRKAYDALLAAERAERGGKGGA